MKCPSCKRTAVDRKAGNKLAPFCSERCQMVDLGRWLGEEYRIPVEPDEEDAQTPQLPADAE